MSPQCSGPVISSQKPQLHDQDIKKIEKIKEIK